MLLQNHLSTILAASLLYTQNAVGQSSDDPCAQAASQQSQGISQHTFPRPDDIVYYIPIDAETAYKCITSVPLNTADAIAMMKIAKQYFSFQTTLAYLKDPPAAYQQASVDVMERLNDVNKSITDAVYKNQYELDLAIQAIVRDTHEGHFDFDAGVLGLFVWSLNDTIVTISLDGKEVPRVYSYHDIVANTSDPSPIVEIQGQNTLTYLRNYLGNGSATGLIDPHAEYNTLMQNSPYQFSQFASSNTASYTPSFFQSTSVYNGNSIKLKFANGTEAEWQYHAGAVQPLTDNDLTSGQSIYDNFVSNTGSGPSQTKRGHKATRTRTRMRRQDSPSNTPLPTAVPFINYPQNPIVIQENFTAGGSVSGYLLDNDSIGVLSLPSFLAVDRLANPTSFHDAVASFIKQAKDKNVKTIIIDLQGNGGGDIYLGYDTFQQFFPNVDSQAMVRSRVTNWINTYGSILTGISRENGTFFTSDVTDSFQPQEMIGAGQINADFTVNTKRGAWKSWGAFCTPQPIHNDNFTKLAQYNLTNSLITESLGFPLVASGNPPFAAENIILLYDGYCASTCNIFSDLMKNGGGVKSVAVGGIPQNSPMQGVAGTRGTSIVPWSDYSGLTTQIQALQNSSGTTAEKAFEAYGVNGTDVDNLPIVLDNAPWDIRSASINALDMIRQDSPEDPRQFAYESSNCRLFYTADMIRDLRFLWRAAGVVAGGNNSLCVPGSVNGPGSAANSTVTGSPGFDFDLTWNNANSTTQGGTDSWGTKLAGSGLALWFGVISTVLISL